MGSAWPLNSGRRQVSPLTCDLHARGTCCDLKERRIRIIADWMLDAEMSEKVLLRVQRAKLATGAAYLGPGPDGGLFSTSSSPARANTSGLQRGPKGRQRRLSRRRRRMYTFMSFPVCGVPMGPLRTSPKAVMNAIDLLKLRMLRYRL